MLRDTRNKIVTSAHSFSERGFAEPNSIAKPDYFASFPFWKTTLLFLSIALTTAPTAGLSQTTTPPQEAQTGTRQSTPQQGNGQSHRPRLTPEQQASQQRAAQETVAQQRAAQQSYSAQNQGGPALDGLNLRNVRTLPQAAVQPAGFPLTAEHSKYVNDLLDYWEQSSLNVKKYKCKFQRFEYDTLFCDYRDPQSNVLAAHSRAFGEIRFASPDRARFETSRVLKFKAPPQKPGELPAYEEQVNESKGVFERWVCDGKTVYDFDFEQKRMYETDIPKDLQGNVANSPLPFVFGANKKQILQRYWVRSITPRGAQDEYWLEIFPKRIEDARIYSKIEIVIAKQDFLPKAMHLYSAQYNPAKGNFESRYFMFENRQVNGQLAKIEDWLGSFIKPRLPMFQGWKTVKGQMNQEQAAVPPTMRPPGSQPTPRRQ